MIKSFRDKRTEKIFLRVAQKGIAHEIEDQIYYRLLLIHTAGDLRDLAKTPGNRVKKLKADRKGQFSIRINNQ